MKAKNKVSLLGADIPLQESIKTQNFPQLKTLKNIDKNDKEIMKKVGINIDKPQQNNTFIQMDQDIVFLNSFNENPGLEILSLSKAINKYNWLKDFYWQSLSVDTDKYTANVELENADGSFIRSLSGQQITLPVQTCFLTKTEGFQQNVHNIIIAEPYSEMHIITGCAVSSHMERALHLGMTEIYVKEGARITYTMVHRWNSGVDVRPRTSVILEKDATYISNYIVLSPVKTLQTDPKIYLRGENARAESYSVVYGSGNSNYDVGGKIFLEAPKTTATLVSRAIASDQSQLITRGEIIGKSTNTKGHLRCDGLLLSEKASINAIPQLGAYTKDAELSHEATVGRIEAEQLYYLMSRGFSEEEAQGLIVQGFMTLTTPELPLGVQKSVEKAIELTLTKGM
ncbi:MAG: SufB/SufD family protein [Candidatus Ranarchaeia archaeon]